MTLQSELVTRANNHAGLTSLIGDRFYWKQMPANATFPLVRFTVVSTPQPDVPTHQGAGEHSITLVQMDSYANDPSTARDVGNQLRACFHAWNNPPNIGYSFLASRLNGDDLEINKHRDILEFTIEHKW